MINRYQLEYAKNRLFKGKALIIMGPRQVGKTTFCNTMLEELDKKVLHLNGDEADVRQLLAKPNRDMLINLIGKNEILFIDEAQRIPDVGLAIKIVVDQIKNIQVIATGSSAFELAGHINEPLTGRKYEIQLLPMSYYELSEHRGFLSETRALPQRLVYGAYPEIINEPAMAEEHLKLLADSYLYKDLFALEQLKKPRLMESIVKALALQVGSEISFNELARLTKSDDKTVAKYIHLLEEAYVVFQLSGFNRNLRNEIRKNKKIYFWDNGILNAVSSGFKPLPQRNDVGRLWENYLVSERLKRNNLLRLKTQANFWRTTQQQEIDYIEETNDYLLAAEFKWNPRKKARFSATFTRAYPNARLAEVNADNYHEFLSL